MTDGIEIVGAKIEDTGKDIQEKIEAQGSIVILLKSQHGLFTNH